MNRFLLCFVTLVFTTIVCSAQDYKTLKNVTFATQEDCVQAQPKVLEVAHLLLSTPCKKELNTLYINDFLIEWLNATESYNFAVDAKFLKIIRNDVYATPRYYAALAKVALEVDFQITQKDLQVQAISEWLRYYTTRSNRVTVNSKLQKYVEAYKKNTLATIIK